MSYSSPGELLVQHILPALFDRLDKAFPEFNWVRTTVGWKGTQPLLNGHTGRGTPAVCCNQPWGYVSDETATSWLNYVNGGKTPDEDSYLTTVAALARRAGIDLTIEESDWRRYEVQQAVRRQRQTDLLEEFVAYCHGQLAGSASQEFTNRLCDTYGVSVGDYRELSIGVYTDPEDVARHLTRCGFHPDEINAVTGDRRLSQRLIIPWRDQHGRIKTIVARDLLQRHGAAAGDLYLKGGTRIDIYGLNVALRNQAEGCEHLVLVDSIADVLFLQSLGVQNVAAITAADRRPNRHHGQFLADAGIRHVTIAVEEGNAKRLLETIREMHKAQCSPEIYVVEAGCCNGRCLPTHHLRSSDLPHFRDLLRHRVHSYRYIANEIVQRHRPATGWDESSLTSMLLEAVAFDAEAKDRQRELQLERHFWPTILETTKLDWDSIRQYLNRRHEPVEQQWPAHWSSRNLKQLVRDLNQLLQDKDYSGIHDLICAAARDLEGDRVIFHLPPQPENRITPTILTREETSPWRSLVVVSSDAPTPSSEDHRAELEKVQPPEPRPSVADIRSLAYCLWENHGRPAGRDQDFWIQAEKELVKQAG